jgi:hypothetical protein
MLHCAGYSTDRTTERCGNGVYYIGLGHSLRLYSDGGRAITPFKKFQAIRTFDLQQVDRLKTASFLASERIKVNRLTSLFVSKLEC